MRELLLALAVITCVKPVEGVFLCLCLCLRLRVVISCCLCLCWCNFADWSDGEEFFKGAWWEGEFVAGEAGCSRGCWR